MPRNRPRPNPSLEEFARYVELLPARLRVWNAGSATLYPLLAWLNTHPVVEQRNVVAEHGPAAVVGMNVAHHNQVGQSVAWAVRFLTDRESTSTSVEADRRALFDLAGRYWTVGNLVAEVRQGVRAFSSEGTRIRLAYRGDRKMDALDRLLSLVDEVIGLGQPEDLAPNERLGRWVAREGRDVPWGGTPGWVRAEYRRFSEELIGRYPNDLPLELDIHGFTIREAVRLCSELLARAVHSQMATMYGSTVAAAIVPRLDSDALVRDLARSAGVGEAATAKIVSLLTFDRQRNPDPCLMPLIPLGDGTVVPMSSLIVPGSPMRNLTALLQDDPAAFGKAGRVLGAQGARTVRETLERLEGAHLATSVPVVWPDGSAAGDLDVVALDPTEGIMAIFEVLWGIAPDGAGQVARAEGRAHGKLEQVARVRAALDSGALPRWPRGWPSVTGVPARWFILTPAVLPVGAVTGDVLIRSHQLLNRMLRTGSSVRELIALLDDPPPPPSELSETAWHRVRIGDYRVDCELVNA